VASVLILPLGVGRVLCDYESRGSLVALYGNSAQLERGVSHTFAVTGAKSGASASIISAMGIFFVDSSEDTFIDKVRYYNMNLTVSKLTDATL
jgi:hypothetical protein|tara:strand:- start:1520 stop:1798 length:279 start_codon:yes stop_codon:yes gene_type:complete